MEVWTRLRRSEGNRYSDCFGGRSEVAVAGDQHEVIVVGAPLARFTKRSQDSPRSTELLRELLRRSAMATQRIHHIHDERSNRYRDPVRSRTGLTVFMVTFLLHRR